MMKIVKLVDHRCILEADGKKFITTIDKEVKQIFINKDGFVVADNMLMMFGISDNRKNYKLDKYFKTEEWKNKKK